jgi:predicted alpha/beta hydrolase
MEYVQEHVDCGMDSIGLQVYPFADDADTLAIFWPAMGVPARYYRSFATRLAECGLAVAVADLRGTGASTPQPSRASRYGFAELAGDVGAVLEALKPRRDGRRTVLIGHSLGGQACALHLALDETSEVDGLALVAVGVPYWRLYSGRRRIGVLPYIQGIGVAARVLRVWPGWGFGGRQAAGVIRDWASTSRTGRYPRLGGVDVEAALAEVRTPVLAIDVEGDQFTPASTVDHLVRKMRSAPATREHYSAAEAGAPLDHFKWARAGGPLAQRIAAWAGEWPNRQLGT